MDELLFGELLFDELGELGELGDRDGGGGVVEPFAEAAPCMCCMCWVDNSFNSFNFFSVFGGVWFDGLFRQVPPRMVSTNSNRLSCGSKCFESELCYCGFNFMDNYF